MTSRKTLDSYTADEHVPDEVVADDLAAVFAARYEPGPPAGQVMRARENIRETLANAMGGTLTNAQANNSNIRSLVMELTAAKHGWVRTQD